MTNLLLNLINLQNSQRITRIHEQLAKNVFLLSCQTVGSHANVNPPTNFRSTNLHAHCPSQLISKTYSRIQRKNPTRGLPKYLTPETFTGQTREKWNQIPPIR